MEVAGSEAAGRKLGRYHLVEPIGGGPTGEVFRAKVYGVAGFERQFAVKRFHPEFVARSQVADEVARAARVYGGLEHPRIARMHEFGVANGETFAATELVDGIDLSRVIAFAHSSGEALPAGAVLKLIAQVARAVGYAHGRGIAHLGLCPTNVLVTPEGEVKVTDFGLLPPRIPERPGDDYTLVARLPYLAPEQVVGEDTGPSTDVFALGAVLYELLTGDKAFRGTTPLEITQALLSSLPPDPDVPVGVVKLIRRTFARSPFERFPDASAMADAIEAAGRAAPLPGDKADAAALVRQAIEAGPSQVMSGAFALPVPAPPPVQDGVPAAAAGPGDPPRRTVMGVAPPAIPPAVPPSALRDSAATMPHMPLVDDEAPTSVRGPDGTSTPAVKEPTLELDAIDLEEQSEPGQPPIVELVASPAKPGEPPNELDLADSSLVLGPDPSEQHSGDFDPVSESTPVPAPMPLAGPSEGGTGQELAITDSEIEAAPPSRAPRSKARLGLMAAAVVVLGGGGFLAYSTLTGTEGAAVADVAGGILTDGDSGGAEAAPRDRAGTAAKAAPPKPRPSTPVAEAPAPAAEPAATDVAVETPVAAEPEPSRPEPADAPDTTGEPGKLTVETRPPGARVFLDGTEVGESPLAVDVAADSHTVAVIKPGYALFRTEIDGGSGAIDTDLEEVSKPGGAAGIKVRCKDKDRYYIILNGRDTGQLCPSERLGVKKGEHVIDIYDVISEERKTFTVTVDQTDRSVRLRVD